MYSSDKHKFFNKKSGDPFFGNNLLEELNIKEVNEIYFTGVSTYNAILYGSNTAMQKGFKPIVIEDACGASSREAHINAINIIKKTSTYQIKKLVK
ncbi:isochorismatase family protein [Francisella halioticida]|uniref:isochorismatase family protein n=1 Tax=Francisella halioticida TaxID=549298 RepID=UPI001FEA5486|nr:isochorismatase family protein [Francisella halioticida]